MQCDFKNSIILELQLGGLQARKKSQILTKFYLEDVGGLVPMHSSGRISLRIKSRDFRHGLESNQS
jgi:hypothetical protein